MTDHIGYLAFRSDPANDDTTDGMWVAQNRLPMELLVNWKQQNPEWAQLALDARRTRYAEHLSAVDSALLKKAQSGDTKAAELLYRRFENWTPKIAEDTLKRNPTTKSFAELIAEQGG